MARPLQDPVPVQAFLWWLWRLAEREEQELDSYPAIADAAAAGSGTGRQRALAAVGWYGDAGERRLHRWTHPEQGDGHSGFAERAIIEDALFLAGVDFSDVYPTVTTRPITVRLGDGRFMTDEEVIEAHAMYIADRMTTRTLADRIWQRYHYASQESCARQLVDAFRGLGLPPRRCDHATAAGARCKNNPLAGSDQCVEHQPGERPSHRAFRSAAARRTERKFTPSPDLLAQVRERHVGGQSFEAIARDLVSLTPLGSASYLASTLARIAAAEGWHRTSHIGAPRRRYDDLAA